MNIYRCRNCFSEDVDSKITDHPTPKDVSVSCNECGASTDWHKWFINAKATWNRQCGISEDTVKRRLRFVKRLKENRERISSQSLLVIAEIINEID